MKKMSEKENETEMLLLLKQLVSKVNALEQAVYDKDNLLMKSGFVTVNTPVPTISGEVAGMDTDEIAKMDWKDINDMMTRMEGGY